MLCLCLRMIKDSSEKLPRLGIYTELGYSLICMRWRVKISCFKHVNTIEFYLSSDNGEDIVKFQLRKLTHFKSINYSSIVKSLNNK